jgi:putative FmdB family regulatory protein
MPIYEYRCGACGVQREYLQKVGESVSRSCPECGSNDFNKLLSAAGFQLKGSGWYVTDFKNKPKPEKKVAKDGKAAEEKKSSSESKSEAAGECGGGACPACE